MANRRRNLIILGLVLALLAASVYAITSKRTVLGLDLRGGTELVYQGRPTPQVPEVKPEDIDRAIEIIRERVDSLGVSEPEITRVGSDQVEIGLPEVSDSQRAIDRIGTTAQLYFYDWEGGPGPGNEANVVPQDPDVADPYERGYNRLYDAVVAASKQNPECFQDLCTAKGPTYYMFDGDSLQPLGEPSQKRSDLFVPYDDKKPPGAKIVAVPQGTVVVEAPPEDQTSTPEVDESQTGQAQYFVLHDRPELSGDEITNPEQNFDPTTNQPNVTFDFTDEGQQEFQDVTRRISLRGQDAYFQATGQPASNASVNDASQSSGSFAIVLDGVVQSRPIINFVENPDGIDGRNGAQISGNFTTTQAQDLAEVLRIGALPIELTLISQSTVSATLGQEALDQGLKAGIVGLIIVLAFLIFYYRFLGVVAGLGLLVYAAFFLAMIKLIPITLTLPGIAGLILTIGVAADSNIVIYERIKEEVRHGRSMLSAIAEGYKKGIATIIDANVIILITAFILFVLASAGVKGFAFTLGIGTIVSLFTAVLFTQAVLGVLGRAKFLRSPSFLGAAGEGRQWKFDFSGASRYFFAISGVILAIGAIAFATKQLNLGIDFESGTRIQAALQEDASVDEVRNALTDADIDGADTAKIQEVENPDFGENVVQVQGKISPEQTTQVGPVLERAFGLEGGQQGIDSQAVGPTFGEQIARSAVIAIVFSLLVIAAYVAIRFEAKYAVPVLIALVHDILITGGVYALVGREVSSATVAAFLTILGYSMYDTIIVFDRIRENVPRMPRAAFTQIVNRSMSEVLTRSLITGLSTVFLIGVLLIFGGETLRDFAFAMMVGVASGTYSSIFIAAPVLTEWKEREPAYRSRRARIKEAMGFVPTFPEDNVVARIDEVERHVPAAAGDGVTQPDGSEAAPAAAGAPVAVAERPAEEAPERRAEEAAEASTERQVEAERSAGEAGGPTPARPEAPAKRTKPSGARKKQSRRQRKRGRSR
ncbi:MAG: protein translocase subunit SecD [Solirubrobacterales bacterium]|nr:protein translocase subunit SecD [Solirubrobacterales bacterium]